MTADLVPFRPRRSDADTSSLATSIFAHLAVSPGVDARKLISDFRKAHPELRTVDFLASVAFAKKILNIFERLMVELDHAGDGDAS
jgi:hypothetical protein